MTRTGRGPTLGATRRGFTLIEVLAVMAGVAVILGLCAVTIQALFRVSSDTQARRSASAALGRLAEQFREDVHAGGDVQLPSSNGLRLSRGPGVEIVYDVREGRVDRVESSDGVSRRESYVLGRGTSTAFERRDEGSAQLPGPGRPSQGASGKARPTSSAGDPGPDRQGPDRATATERSAGPMIKSAADRSRRGLLAIAVMVCLIVLALIAAAILRTGRAQRDEVRIQERRLQAEWLAEAGLWRALARLDAEPGYTGETWQIDAKALDAPDAATVAIAIERPPGDPKARTIRVRADYPRDPPRRARCSRQLTTSLGPG